MPDSHSQDPEFALTSLLGSWGQVAVALSGGVDSSILLAFASSTLGSDQCLALTVNTPYMIKEEIDDAVQLCASLGVRHIVLDEPFPNDLTNNPPDRCYLCKTRLFAALVQQARENGFEHLIDGTNADDSREDRPGMRALDEWNIASPFRETGFSKEAIRALGRRLGLATTLTDKPSCTCLLTRLEHNRPVLQETLKRVGLGEQFLHHAGFYLCRVRVHGSLARIELPRSDWSTFFIHNMPDLVVDYFRQIGFSSVSLDLAGYASGNMTIHH